MSAGEEFTRETQLYPPIRDMLVARGYTVRSEVGGCDIVATRGDDLVVVELKRRPSLALLIQAAQRQRVADSVYVALPKPEGREMDLRWRRLQHLLRRLELGLILVSFSTPVPTVEVAFDPQPFRPRRDCRRRRVLLGELAARSGEHNQGGSCRRGIVTAYREKALFIACCLERYGPLTPARLRDLGAGEKTLSILSRNVYGWFQRVDHGVYALTPAGQKGLEEYADIVAQFRRALEAHSPQ